MGLGAFGIPAVLIGGDNNAVAEAADLIPQIEQVAVRWRDDRGEVRFLTSEEAGIRLQEAARSGVSRKLRPYKPALPVSVELRVLSPGLLAERSPSLGKAFEERAAGQGLDRSRLGDFSFGRAPGVDRDQVAWQAPTALAA